MDSLWGEPFTHVILIMNCFSFNKIVLQIWPVSGAFIISVFKCAKINLHFSISIWKKPIPFPSQTHNLNRLHDCLQFVHIFFNRRNWIKCSGTSVIDLLCLIVKQFFIQKKNICKKSLKSTKISEILEQYYMCLKTEGNRMQFERA